MVPESNIFNKQIKKKGEGKPNMVNKHICID